jgi:GNAT superfamily N-acetyltransferase
VEVLITSLADRPDLAALLDQFSDNWPEFMYHDAVSRLLYEELAVAYPQHCLIAVAGSAPVARAFSIPFAWAGDPATDLPTGGHDAVIVRAAADRLAGRPANLVAAVEVTVQAHRRGTGLSARMLDALRRHTARLGYRSLVVPVRPNRKHEYPELPMTRYARWTGDDGLPVDPWLRVHVRAGGRVVGVAPTSTTIAGSLADWRAWTGLPFDATGPVRVPGALVPVHCDVDQDVAVYVEPNVWVHHRLSP